MHEKRDPGCLSVPIKFWQKDDWKKFMTLAGGCVPEASTLPPVTVSRILHKNHLIL